MAIVEMPKRHHYKLSERNDDINHRAMSMSGLSIIIPNYNHGHFLPQSLGAIAPQLRPTDELIILDDASTDGSREIISDFARRFSRIRPVFLEKNSGVVANINRGLAMANNEYVYFGAADDYVLPDFVETMMEAARRHPQAGLITSDPAYLRSDTEKIDVIPMQLGTSERYLGPRAVVALGQAREFGVGLTAYTSILRRQALIDAGGFIPELEFCCDWFAYYVVVFRQGFAYVPRNMAVMRLSPTTYSAVGWSSWARRRPVLLELTHLLMSEPYHDVRIAFADSGVLNQFNPDILRLALQSSDARALLRARNVWFSMKEALRRAGFGNLVPKQLKAMRRQRESLRAKRVFNIDT